MDTALSQKFPFILDRNLAKANCTGNQVCTSCDTVVLTKHKKINRIQSQQKSTHSTKKYSYVTTLAMMQHEVQIEFEIMKDCYTKLFVCYGLTHYCLKPFSPSNFERA